MEKKKIRIGFRIGEIAQVIRLLNAGKESSKYPFDRKGSSPHVEPMQYYRDSWEKTRIAMFDAEYKRAKGLNDWKKRNFL
jgi:hypothetical protein